MKKLERKAGFLIALILITSMMISFSGCGQTGKPAGNAGKSRNTSADEKEVRDLVDRYMTALKDKDVKTLVDMSGFIEKLPAENREMMKNNIVSTLEQAMNGMGMTIEEYTIEKVDMDGGLAVVHVKETSSFKGGMGGNAKSETKTVTDKIIVIRMNGKWKIDGMNTLNVAEFDMNKLSDPQKVQELANSFGVGRAFAVIVDPQTALILGGIIAPNFMRARGQGQFTQCQSNMKNIATALEMYSTDHSGHYPKSLKELTPDYLRMIPTCAAAGKDTYSSTYQGNQSPDRYTFYCSGHNHGNVGVPSNFPQYNSTMGLIPRPR